MHMMMDERENDEKNVMGCRGSSDEGCILPCSGLTLLPAAAQGRPVISLEECEPPA